MERQIVPAGARVLAVQEDPKAERRRQLAQRVLTLSRDTLLVHLRYLDTALSQLEYVICDATTLMTDGEHLLYDPIHILRSFSKEKEISVRDYLHVILHCIYRHMFVNPNVEKRLWDLAADIAVESCITELDMPCAAASRQGAQATAIQNLQRRVNLITAEKLYRYFRDGNVSEDQIDRLCGLFHVDDHSIWYMSSEQANAQYGNLGGGGDRQDDDGTGEDGEDQDENAKKKQQKRRRQPQRDNEDEDDPDDSSDEDNSQEGEDPPDEENTGEDGSYQEDESSEEDESGGNGSGEEEKSQTDDETEEDSASDSDDDEEGDDDSGDGDSREEDEEDPGADEDDSDADDAGASDADEDGDGQDENGSGEGDGSETADVGGAGSGSQSRPGGFHLRREDLAQAWRDIAEHIQMDLETFSKNQGDQAGGMVQNLREVNRDRTDYGEFLRRFCVMGEVMKIDPDEFDYIFYTYGLQLNGNMPLIEQLEYREVRRIKEFVIAIDTSGSVEGETVQKFVEKTYGILRSTESFFTKVNVYIIQCDAEIQEEVKITSLEEFEEYGKHMQIHGLGGTDFRPVFRRVEELRRSGELKQLKGLIYFTDGYGTFPERMPDYQTAFIFLDDAYNNPVVPPWAIRLTLGRDEICNSDNLYR